MTKQATPDHPIHELVADRWSPYVFADKDVSDDDLRSIFEAVRWAASSYNEQPWRYIVAKRRDADAFAKLLTCLVEPNQAWAKKASVLALGVISESFELNGKPNAAAEHDLGLASGSLTFEATARGLSVHQMIGILPAIARDAYRIPEGFRALTALAIGYAGDPDQADGELGDRDKGTRSRKPLPEIVFGDAWGVSSPLTQT